MCQRGKSGGRQIAPNLMVIVLPSQADPESGRRQADGRGRTCSVCLLPLSRSRAQRDGGIVVACGFNTASYSGGVDERLVPEHLAWLRSIESSRTMSSTINGDYAPHIEVQYQYLEAGCQICGRYMAGHETVCLCVRVCAHIFAGGVRRLIQSRMPRSSSECELWWWWWW